MRIMYIITQDDTLTISPGNLFWKYGRHQIKILIFV